MLGLLSILSYLGSDFNSFNNTVARMLDYVYRMTL